uniref:Si:dkey-71h2.2 n=1 Tax=Gouania willdenowi TaxID=441366 RepID=A0A8C5EDZ1_GOUWI
MDALKSAGRAIIKSPGVPRHTWGTSKHEKLPENWTDTKETLLEGMVFNVKYLGMTMVGQPKGEDMASAAIHRIVTTARASTKKFRKVTLTVSPKGIIITDTETTDLIEDVSIYRISYCTADKTQDKVFAYVSQSQFNESLECHAFLCQKKKIAQAVTLTVAQAFKVALDLWEIAQEDKSKKARTCCPCAASNRRTETTVTPCAPAGKSICFFHPRTCTQKGKLYLSALRAKVVNTGPILTFAIIKLLNLKMPVLSIKCQARA